MMDMCQSVSVNPLVERIAAERKRRGWSARDAAKAGGISNTTWSRWETAAGAAPPSDTIRQAVAQAFGWETDWPENPPPLPTPTVHGPDLEAGVAYLRELNDKDYHC